MELSTPTHVLNAFYRLAGTTSDDDALTEHGEAANDVAWTFLTLGCREAQRWMLKCGSGEWRKRSSALSFSGTDAADGGRYATLPTDFLRAWGSRNESALVEADGDSWGQEVGSRDTQLKGDGYYLMGSTLWLTRTAAPPAVLYLLYHYVHPTWSASVTIDFPMDARLLIVAEAAQVAMAEAWLPGDAAMERKIEVAAMRARERARDLCRATKSPRTLRRAYRAGNRW